MITKSQILADIQSRIDNIEKEIIANNNKSSKYTAKNLKDKLYIQKEAYNFNYWLAYYR